MLIQHRALIWPRSDLCGDPCRRGRCLVPVAAVGKTNLACVQWSHVR